MPWTGPSRFTYSVRSEKEKILQNLDAGCLLEVLDESARVLARGRLDVHEHEGDYHAITIKLDKRPARGNGLSRWHLFGQPQRGDRTAPIIHFLDE